MIVIVFTSGKLPQVSEVETYEEAARFIFLNHQYDNDVFVLMMGGIVHETGFFDIWKEEQFPGHRIEI